MGKYKSGQEMRPAKPRPKGKKALTKLLVDEPQTRSGCERPSKRRVDSATRLNHPRVAALRGRQTDFAANTKLAIERAQAHARANRWSDRVPEEVLAEAKTKRRNVKSKERVIVIDELNRVGVGKKVVEYTDKTGSTYVVIHRQWLRGVPNCRSPWVAVPPTRIFN